MRRGDTPIKKIPNNLHSYTTLSEVGHDSPPFMGKISGGEVGITFQRGWYSNRGKAWRYTLLSLMEEPGQSLGFREMIKGNISNDKSC